MEEFIFLRVERSGHIRYTFCQTGRRPIQDPNYTETILGDVLDLTATVFSVTYQTVAAESVSEQVTGKQS